MDDEEIGGISAATQVLVQPDDGVAPLLALIAGAERSLYVKQFRFTHPALLAASIAAHRAGRDVRIMLNPHASSGVRVNDAIFAALEAAGVKVLWTSPDFYVTHEKSMVVDDRLALVATFNWDEKYFTQTRDYGVVLDQPGAVAEIRDCFMADWERRSFRPAADSILLWSNLNSREMMSAFIDRAHRSLDIQHPKFVDAAILDRIVQAHQRGVHVRLLCGGGHGLAGLDRIDTFASLRVMGQFGIKVHKQRNLRPHAKLLIADGKRALLGSMNIDRSAFDLCRELGATVTGKPALRRLSEVFEVDWREAHRYEAPDPILAHAHVEEGFPHDPAMMHD
jgi:cardiolipin synthase A/B